MALYKYRPERIHKRMGYVQYAYKNRDTYSAFEDCTFPIALYNRDGIIAAVNKRFYDFTGVKDIDIQHGKINIFELFDNENAGLLEAARNAFDGKEIVYRSGKRILRAEPDTPEDRLLKKHPNAMFYPMTRDNNGIKLVGILLDDNRTDEGETID